MQFLRQERPLVKSEVKSVSQCTSYSRICKEQKQQHRDNLRTAVAGTKDSKATKTHHLDAPVDEYNLFTVTSNSNQPLTVSLTLTGANLIMEIDTG